MDILITRLKTKNPDLKEAEIGGLLFLLKENHGLEVNDLTKLTGIPKETLKKFIISLGPTYDLENFDLKPYKWSLVSYSGEEFSSVVTRFSEITANLKIAPKRDLDQFFATNYSTVSKAFVLKDRGCLDGKKIALFGDDDLLSIALAIMGGFSSITVFDIDPDLLAVIKDITTVLGITNVQTVKIDAKDSSKGFSKLDAFVGKFDVIVTDPPYTKSGITLFLNKCIYLLNPTIANSDKYIFLYYGNSFKSPEKILKIQDIIGKFNLVIEDKIDKFARYSGAESIGNSSSLYILKTTPFTKSLDDSFVPESIYTYENQKEEKFPYVSHYVFKLFGVSQKLITSKSGMLRILGQFCIAHKLKVIDQITTSFKGKGFTFTFILGNSNLLVHTWPEHEALHIDLVTCSPIYNKELLGSNLVKMFTAKGVEVNEVE